METTQISKDHKCHQLFDTLPIIQQITEKKMFMTVYSFCLSPSLWQLLASCLQASGETLTGVGSLENPLLIGSMFDTVSNQPQRKQVTTTSTWANDRREVVVKGVEDYKYILFIITQAGVSRNYFLHTVICAEYHLEFLKSLLRMSFLKSAP